MHVDLREGDADRTMFIAHMDTMHKDEGINAFKRMADGVWHADGDVLGADDGAGVAMLVHLAMAKVPGYYLFTVGEERGGIGAKAAARATPEKWQQFDRAIAFDRRGVDSVITEQFGGMTASDAFATTLSLQLMEHSADALMYSPDPTGVYTDTAEFSDLIAECTNISVGYDHEHTARESLDVRHFETLAMAAMQVKWDELPTVRTPGDNGWDYRATSAMWSKEDAFEHTLGSTEYDDLCDALVEAEEGNLSRLRDLLAEAIYPEDLGLASAYIGRMHIAPELIDAAWEDMDMADPTDVLLEMYDKMMLTNGV